MSQLNPHLHPIPTPAPGSTFKLALNLGDHTKVYGWPEPVPTYSAAIAESVKRDQAQRRLVAIRDIATQRIARLGLHADPSDDLPDTDEIVHRLGPLRIVSDEG